MQFESSRMIEALEWWKALDVKDQEELAKKTFPHVQFIFVKTSPTKIKAIYEYVEEL